MNSTKEAMAVELDGKITIANDSFVKMFGYNMNGQERSHGLVLLMMVTE